MLQVEEMIDVNLDSPGKTADITHPAAIKKCITFNRNVDNIQYQGEDTTDFPSPRQRLRTWSSTLSDKDDEKSHLRYYSVGPNTYQVRCPLCKKRSDAETVQMSGFMGQLSCLLSSLSCCFPIFSLSFVYLCLQSRLKSKRMFCNKCGGHLGFYWRPT